MENLPALETEFEIQKKKLIFGHACEDTNDFPFSSASQVSEKGEGDDW